MSFPNATPERLIVPPGETHENRQDVIPPTERGEDPERNRMEHGLVGDASRPLTEEERKAADRDAPAGERVYAPASERVPKDPLPGHREMVEHADTHTPEREALPPTPTEEPSFTRVTRPATPVTPTPGAYASAMSNPAFAEPYSSDDGGGPSKKLFFGIGASWLGVIAAGVGIWLFMRWRNERNKPINRLRRQARKAATELRDRMPDPEEAARPAMGMTTALMSILLILWRQKQSRSAKTSKSVSKRADKAAQRANEVVGDADWQKRLSKLKERWDPSRLELEKVSISRK